MKHDPKDREGRPALTVLFWVGAAGGWSFHSEAVASVSDTGNRSALALIFLTRVFWGGAISFALYSVAGKAAMRRMSPLASAPGVSPPAPAARAPRR